MEDNRSVTPEIRAQLDRLETSAQFVNSERMRRFLAYSVERSVARDFERLKESAIGVEIFGRPVGYDPKADSIVRVEAYRLRQKLVKYYETEGANDPIIISLNKGSYVATIERRPRPEPESIPAPEAGATKPAMPWWIPALASALFVLVATVLWREWGPVAPVRSLGITKLTSDGGWSGDPVLSPDGRSVFYASDRGAESHLSIWRAPVDGREPVRITEGEEDEIEPDIAPDGQTLVYRQRRGDSSGIWRLSLNGGTPPALMVQGGSQPRLSPDGKWILYTVRNEQEWSAGRIYVIPTNGGAPRQLATSFADAHYAIWSRDGKSILFCGTQTSGVAEFEHDWWIQPFPEGEAVKTKVFPTMKKQLGNAGFGPPSSQMERPGDWTGGRVYYASSEGALVSVWRLPLNPLNFTWPGTPPPERLTSGTGLDLSPRVQGGRMVFSSGSYNVDVWSQDIGTGALRRLVSHPAAETFPALDPSGNFLAFSSDRTGVKQVYVRDLRNQAELALRASRFAQDYAVFSNRGDWLAFREQGAPKLPIFLAKPGGGVVRQVCEDCGGPTSFSPDDQHLLFEPGAAIAYVGRLNVATGAQAPFLTHAEHSLRGARYSPDGKWIAFYEETGTITRRLWLARGDASTLPKAWIPLTDGEYADMAPTWSADGSTVYFLSDRDGHRCIYGQKIDKQTGRPVGDSFAVRHHHSARRSLLRLTRARLAAVGLRTHGERLLFSMDERSADIYMAKLPE